MRDLSLFASFFQSNGCNLRSNFSFIQVSIWVFYNSLWRALPNYLYKYTFSIFILLKTYLKMTIYAIFFSNASYLRKRLDFRRVHSDELTIWYAKDFQLSPVNSKNVLSQLKILSLDWFTIQSWQVEVQNAKLANIKMTIII